MFKIFNLLKKIKSFNIILQKKKKILYNIYIYIYIFFFFFFFFFLFFFYFFFEKFLLKNIIYFFLAKIKWLIILCLGSENSIGVTFDDS